MANMILCSTGTIVGKANGFDHRLIIRYRDEIDADGFERTVFLSERNLSVKNENKTVSAKLSNLVG